MNFLDSGIQLINSFTICILYLKHNLTNHKKYVVINLCSIYSSIILFLTMFSCNKIFIYLTSTFLMFFLNFYLLNYSVKVKILLSLIFITVNQLIFSFFIFVLFCLFQMNINIVLSDILIRLLILLILFLIEQELWNWIIKQINNYLLDEITEVFYPLFIIHCLFYVSNIHINVNVGIRTIETFYYQTLAFIVLFVLYIMLFYYLILKDKILKEHLKEELYRSEILLLNNIIGSYVSLQNDFHEMYSFLMGNKREEVQQFLKKREPLLRVASCDQNLNLVINALINLPEYNDLQFDYYIVNKVEIDKTDLLVLLYELFNLLSDKRYVKISSINYLEIIIKIEKHCKITRNIDIIVNKYNGMYTVKDDELSIILFYYRIVDNNNR